MKKLSKIVSVFMSVIVMLIAVFPSHTNAQTVNKQTASFDGNINCYAACNGSWKLINTITTRNQAYFTNKYRFYVTATELESVYSSLGFSASSFKGERIFPHTDDYDKNNIWADATPIFDDDLNTYLIPVSHRASSNLYFMPSNIEGNSSYFTISCKTNDQTIIDANNFYTVEFDDSKGFIPDGTSPSLPETIYLKNGESRTITLPLVDDVEYEITDASTGQAIDLEQAKDTANKTVTITVSNISQGIKVSTKSNTVIGKNEALIYCYVAVDGEWKLVSKKITDKKYKYDKNRFYITSKELENIYSKYGFNEAEYKGEAFFPQSDSYDPNNIWADCAPIYNNEQSTYFVPLSHRQELYLYYMPHNSSEYASYFTTSCGVSDKNVLADNSFYTLKYIDTKKLLPDGSLPSDDLLLSGSSKQIVLPYDENVIYKTLDGKTSENLNLSQTIDKNAKTVTITIDKINCPIVISTSTGAPTLIYNSSVSNGLVTICEYPANMQSIENDATINGQLIYSEEISASTGTKYKILDIDSTTATVIIPGARWNNRHYIYTFAGWKLNGTGKIYQPGDEVSVADLKAGEDENNEVHLIATWSIFDSNERANSINFYLNLDCEIMDNLSNGFNHQHQDKFTQSIYTTRIFGTDNIEDTTDKYVQVLAPPTSVDNAYETDTLLRNSMITPISPGVSIESFPSDESIFAKLRAQDTTFTLDGHTITSQYLTSDYFTIRWYVLKYEKNDAWHIDGVLVAKQAKLVVKKTFLGDAEAIEKVKKNFSISINHNNDTNKTVNDFTLTLNSKDDETDSAKTGYTSYDPETDTYTWSLITRQNRDYNIIENNNTLDPNKWNNSLQYKVTNSDNETSGWQLYDNSGVNVKTIAYPSDVPDTGLQTVEFRNMYVQSGLLTVQKIDTTTQNGLKNVKFKISKVDGSNLTLYKKPDSADYSTDPASKSVGYNEVVADNTVETDANGYFNIRLAIHGTGKLSEEYYLEETIPNGYEGPSKIKVTVTDLGKIELAQEVIESSTIEHSDWLDGEGTNILTVKNKSKLLTSVIARKDWGNTDESKVKDVQVQLWRNGAKLTDSAFTKTLNSSNSWEYEWKDLPLYVDGKPATYEIREVAIGSTQYDADADTDGFEDYAVTYDTPLYKEGDNGTYTANQTWVDNNGNRHYADHALLVVHNRLIEGNIAFAKIDDEYRPLQGAEFTLYSDEECTNVVETAVSDIGGYVSFNSKSAGTYYMKETKAPANYLQNDTIYKIVVRAGKVTITENGGTTPITHITNYYILRNLEFSFIKTNQEHKELAGAKFGIYKLICTDETHNHNDDSDLIKVNSDGSLKEESSSCWELVDVQTSAKKTGLVKFENLRGSETYRLVEITPPSGYSSPKGQWKVTYDIENSKFNITAIGLVSKTPAFEQVENQLAPYRVMNYKLDDMPSSGGNGIAIYEYLGGALIGLGVVALIILIIKKKNNK